MTPAQFNGLKAVFRARQNRLALLGCSVFMVSLRVTEDRSIAELTTTAFLNLATPRVSKAVVALNFDFGTAEGV